MQNKLNELSELLHKTENDIYEIANGASTILSILYRLEKHLSKDELAHLQSKTETLDEKYALHSFQFYDIKKNNRPRSLEVIEKSLQHLGQQTQALLTEMDALRNQCIDLGDTLGIDIGLYDFEEDAGRNYPLPSPRSK